MYRRITWLSVLAVALLFLPSVQADIIWTNTTHNQSWGDIGNWDLGRLPDSGDMAQVNMVGGDASIIDGATTATVGQLVVGHTGDGELLIDGGTLNCTNTSTWTFVVGGVPGGNATVTVQSDTTDPYINVALHSYVGVGPSANGVINFNDGLWENMWHIWFGHDEWGNNGGSGTIYLNGGTIKTNRLEMSTGTGLIDISGGTLICRGEWYDAPTEIQGFIDAGYIIAHGGDLGWQLDMQVEQVGDWSQVTLTAVPEPATLLLLGLGSSVLLRQRRKS
jgi:hypothetical protein